MDILPPIRIYPTIFDGFIQGLTIAGGFILFGTLTQLMTWKREDRRRAQMTPPVASVSAEGTPFGERSEAIRVVVRIASQIDIPFALSAPTIEMELKRLAEAGEVDEPPKAVVTDRETIKAYDLTLAPRAAAEYEVLFYVPIGETWHITANIDAFSGESDSPGRRTLDVSTVYRSAHS